MSSSVLNRKFSVLVTAGITLAVLKKARAGQFGNLSSKIVWISSITIGLLLRQLLAGPKNRLITSPNKLIGESEEYDFIIVGGGTAGCVLASRLSEDPLIKVLLLESGVSGKSLLLTRFPIGFPQLFHGKHDYNLYTEPQSKAQGKTKYWPRGKMLGGCSSINAQMAQYGAPGDFDEWATIIKDEAWSWKNFSRYFRKFERYVGGPEHHDVHNTVKGKDGPMRVGYFSTVSEASKDFVEACINIGIPYSADFNTDLGTRGVNRYVNFFMRSGGLFKISVTYIDERRTRVSSETAYLTDEVLARPNLKVAIHASVTKIITEKVSDTIKAISVEFASSKDGPRFKAHSKRDIIISAGAVHSPQILMFSGIGPADHLEKMKIPVVHNLPGVGSHLIDHPVVDVYFKNKLNNSPKHINPRSIVEVFKLFGSAYQYLSSQGGPLATNSGETAAFCRSDDPVLFPDEYPHIKDSTSAADSPDLEIFTTPLAYKEHGAFVFPMHTFSIHVCLLRPMSRGTLRLKSADPFEAPAINPNYLEAPEDVEKIRRGLKLIMNISKQEPLAAKLGLNDPHPLLDSNIDQKTNEELENIIRERVETLYHPTSTCRMAPVEEGGVVDSSLRVYGIKGLRVCDASIFPQIISGHTAGACLASAEHLADIIKAELKAEKA